MGVLYRFQSTIITNSLLHRLLYIFSEISTYLYDFQRVSIHFFLKKIILIFFKKTDGNALENWQPCTYFIENVLDNIQ